MNVIKPNSKLKLINPDDFLPTELFSENKINFEFLNEMANQLKEIINLPIPNISRVNDINLVMQNNPFNLGYNDISEINDLDSWGIPEFSNSPSTDSPKFALHDNNGFIHFDYRLLKQNDSKSGIQLILGFYNKYKRSFPTNSYTHVEIDKKSKMQKFLKDVIKREDYFGNLEFCSDTVDFGDFVEQRIKSFDTDRNLPRYRITSVGDSHKIANMYLNVSKSK